MEWWLRRRNGEFVMEVVVVLVEVNGGGKQTWIDVVIFIKAL